MPARDMSGLVRDDPDDLIWRIGLLQCSRMHKHIAGIENEGIEAVMLDDAHLHFARAKSCHAKNR